jgi:hypothetical protein
LVRVNHCTEDLCESDLLASGEAFFIKLYGGKQVNKAISLINQLGYKVFFFKKRKHPK